MRARFLKKTYFFSEKEEKLFFSEKKYYTVRELFMLAADPHAYSNIHIAHDHEMYGFYLLHFKFRLASSFV